MQSYLQKHACFHKLIEEPPEKSLEAIIVIPAFHETDLINAINSLSAAVTMERSTEVIVVLNVPETMAQLLHSFHLQQINELNEWNKKHVSEKFRLHYIGPISFPDKIAGVGMARKVGMDEAVRRFESVDKDGIIINYDADCRCDPGYLTSILDFFESPESTQALSIGFRHRTTDLDPTLKEAIEIYELHLRCYIGWQQYYSYPYAFQTLGSCFAVRSSAYQKQGGMNRRKAGEDFYFLHKFSLHAQLSELNKPLVFPSGRISHRVPFGTGKAVHEIVNAKAQYLSYNPEGIKIFTGFMHRVGEAYDLLSKGQSYLDLHTSLALKQYLENQYFQKAIDEALANSNGATSYQSRIHKWFNPFRLMKFLHEAADSEFPDVDVLISAKLLLENRSGNKVSESLKAEELIDELLNFKSSGI
jgi:hypothetical protein